MEWIFNLIDNEVETASLRLFGYYLFISVTISVAAVLVTGLLSRHILVPSSSLSRRALVPPKGTDTAYARQDPVFASVSQIRWAVHTVRLLSSVQRSIISGLWLFRGILRPGTLAVTALAIWVHRGPNGGAGAGLSSPVRSLTAQLEAADPQLIVGVATLSLAAIPFVVATLIALFRGGLIDSVRARNEASQLANAHLARLSAVLDDMRRPAWELSESLLQRREFLISDVVQEASNFTYDWHESSGLERASRYRRGYQHGKRDDSWREDEDSIPGLFERCRSITKSAHDEGIEFVCIQTCLPIYSHLQRLDLTRWDKDDAGGFGEKYLCLADRVERQLSQLEKKVRESLGEVGRADESLVEGEISKQIKVCAHEIDQILVRQMLTQEHLLEVVRFLRRRIVGGRTRRVLGLILR